MNDNGRNGFYQRKWNGKAGVFETGHVSNPALARLYDLLTAPVLGYEMSEEERAMRDGTHELFKGETKE